MTRPKDKDQDTGFGFGGLFKGLAALVEKLVDLAEKGESVSPISLPFEGGGSEWA